MNLLSLAERCQFINAGFSKLKPNFSLTGINPDIFKIQTLNWTLRDVDDKSFAQTDSEEKILDEILELVPPEGMFAVPDASTNELCESHSSSIDVTCVEEAMKCLNLDKSEDDSIKLNQICELYDGKCFYHL
ncbi:hypothetical protein AVEN_263542-1 [Araneus ventricosus]|uniref:Uncharacterized protein n=1 Tax=Araneus ventricosus TaxID=182803 RepID=A0A4Y2QTL9_ARAVE|nr:hypothetical protein AVEN_263542-1 [Araneus ventricosus]